jgi:hypothetical protein
VEMLSEALTNAIRAPPKHVCKFHGIWREDLAGCFLEVGELYVLWVRASGQLDVEAHEITAFAWNDDQVAGGAVDSAFAAYVGESGEWVDVHDAPDAVGRVAEHAVAEGFANRGVCAVAGLEEELVR